MIFKRPTNSVTVNTRYVLNFTDFFVTRLSGTRLDFETALPETSVRIVRPINRSPFIRKSRLVPGLYDSESANANSYLHKRYFCVSHANTIISWIMHIDRTLH